MNNNNIWTNPYNPFQFWKTLAWYDEMISIKEGKFQAPVNVALDLLSGTDSKKLCGGFKCKMCMSDLADDEKIYKIESELLMKMPKFFSEWGVKSLCIAGHNSDPCAYPHNDLINFLELCKKYKIDIGLVSNGALYTDYLMQIVVRTTNWSGFSVNAGTEEDHEKITGRKGAFNLVMSNMRRMADLVKANNLPHKIGYKFLILPDNYNHIFEAAEQAKKNGARHMQIRPCQLSEDQVSLIDTKIVEEQIKESLKLEIPGQFEIFGIREKFNPEFKKVQPKRCIASPLGSTWMANGKVVICPDRRWSENNPIMVLGNFVENGLESIKELWGSEKHFKMIEAYNKDLDNCIRCTSLKWHEIFEQCVEEDNLDISLI